MTVDRHEPPEVSWAREWMARQIQADLRIADIEPVASRLARLHRVTVVGRGGDRTHAFLKRYDPEIGATWPARLADLTAVSEAVTGTPGLLPYVILAADRSEGVLLTAEVPGRPLTAWHRPSIVSPRARRIATEAWRGAGRWLGRVHGHARPALASRSRVGEIAGEVFTRLDLWRAADPLRVPLAEATRAAVNAAAIQLAGRTVTLVLCHGDVTPGNILVDHTGVGLVDLDDVRVDMPALDLSQARLAIDEFGHLGWTSAPRHLSRMRWRAAFAEGYGLPMPEGPEFWLPHFRNLVVYLLTLARQRTGLRVRRLATELHYRRLIGELEATIIDVQRGRGSWLRGS